MTKEEPEDLLPRTIVKLEWTDIYYAIDSFDADIQKVLEDMTWDAALIDKIVSKLSRRYESSYRGETWLSAIIKEVLKEEIERVEEERGFLSGLKRYTRGMKK